MSAFYRCLRALRDSGGISELRICGLYSVRMLVRLLSSTAGRCPCPVLITVNAILRSLLVMFALVGQAVAAPSLWEVRDAQGSVRAYLFGTVHLCNASCYPLPGPVNDAFSRSERVAFELDVTDPAVLAAISAAGLLPEGERLSHRLPQAVFRDLSNVAERLGLPSALLQSMQPWFATNWLLSAAAAEAGFSTDHGVDLVLHGRAVAAGKRLTSLETVERQVLALSAGGDEAQQEALVQTLTLVQDQQLQAYLSRMISAWARGDDEALMMLMFEGMDAEAIEPLMTDLIDARNAEMSLRIHALLDDPEPLFVAVGGGHMVGETGIPTQLARMGWRVSKVSPAIVPTAY